ncbi:MAG: glycosyltransferase [Nitrospirota bacterium]
MQHRAVHAPLTVLNVAYPLAPVGPDAVGGAEQVLGMIDDFLVRSGHRSVVIACEGSAVRGALISTPRVEGRIDEAARAFVREQHRRAIKKALSAGHIDVVHMHGIDFEHYLPPEGAPALVTLHLPLAWYPPSSLRPARPLTYLHTVSAAQHATRPRSLDLLPPIDNGVPVEELSLTVSKRNFVLSLGRICPEKGFHLALDAAGRAGIPLILAGALYPYEVHMRYFTEEIRPRLEGRQHRFLGPVGFFRKRRLLTAARCLLIPSLVAETSSLAAMEALACGTPVIAFPSGALADIVEQGKTGFIVRDVREMAEAIAAAPEIDPGLCRSEARRRFSHTAMVQRYLERYCALAANRKLSSKECEVS